MWASPRSKRTRDLRYPEDYDVIWAPKWDSPSLLSDCHTRSSLSDVSCESIEQIRHSHKGRGLRGAPGARGPQKQTYAKARAHTRRLGVWTVHG